MCALVGGVAGARAIEETKRDLEGSRLLAPLVGHVGDGNFHVFLLMREGSEEDEEEARRLNARMVRRAVRLGGTCTGEHGVGVGKRGYLEAELGAGALGVMASVKRALDPRHLLNPGKVLPDAYGPVVVERS